MATQNPIEHEGVYPLPEAQRDRFLFKLNIDYPSPEEEREIIYRMGVTPPQAKQILEHRRPAAAAGSRGQYASSTTRWSTTWSASSSPPAHPEQLGMNDVKGWIAYGASPRASLGIIAAVARARPGTRTRLRDPAGRHRGHPRRAAAPAGADLRRGRRRDLRRDRHQPDPADGRAAAGECRSAARTFGGAGDAGCSGGAVGDRRPRTVVSTCRR